MNKNIDKALFSSVNSSSRSTPPFAFHYRYGRYNSYKPNLRNYSIILYYVPNILIFYCKLITLVVEAVT